MKKILFCIVLLSAALIMACNEDSSTDSSSDYVNPGFTEKTLNPKSYSGFGTADCPEGTGCQAIIYQGKINKVNYVGIAIKNGTYNLKVYWPGTSVEFSSTDVTGCTVIDDGTKVTDQTITMQIVNEGDTTYTITFQSAVSGTSITSGDTIRAQLY